MPSFEEATRLCLSLALDWFTWIQTYDDRRLLVVMLVPEADDVAALLRTVQKWGRQQRLAAIPFALDGRRYVLDSWSRSATEMAA